MKKGWKSRISLLTVLMLLVSMIPSYAASYDLQNVVSETAKYLLSTVQEPKLGSIGGEWAVLGLARSGESVPKTYFEKYYRGLEKEVVSKKGILHEQKYTEYSRVVLALSSLGLNPQNVGGYDLVKPLMNVEKGKWQGVNGSVFALLALDASSHWLEKDKAAYEAARKGYLKDILDKQLADGGWAFTGDKADVDMTAMTLQSLAKYQSNPEVKTATEKALQTLSNLQNEKGGYASWGEENSESVSQTIVALSELGIPLDSKSFVKNGNSLSDNLMTFYVKGQGFKHSPKGEVNAMATEQAFYALVAANRIKQNKSSLYRMQDAVGFLIIDNPSEPAPKPPGDSLINVREVIAPGRTFSDIQGSKYKNAIEKLAERGIVNGQSKDEFKPNLKVTRAEFAVIVLNGLGIQPKSAGNVFKDVKPKAWYASYVNTAHQLKIVNGVGDNKFNPNGDITIQEAAVMVTNAARLGNLRTNYSTAEIRDILAQFEDYTTAGDWARESLAFCYANGVWSDSAVKIRPREQITRGEVAETVFNLMNKMELIR
ncbi:MAG: S-layer homology domain-containing protein [Peptostreptococcaceae bacterium]|nr:S-layer homology domain-containing protein [Peptostreptococcaceae bacterium]